ncbi:nucleotide pyrophosphohydrolase [Accumulibacter sp.]|jgi:NTP pyrophosphatase (non-canonical NTP hydrolase)|uniref:MazG nucleotide pyrophosphohydrolase n=1 Tax=Accumulibacter regalis TaxID=522306 RepID=C7RQY6_ACCRE|nr:nucleotide pyrophosphohydrolase [Accumulibacter sp.]MBN8495271.1 nucleotide pyrophosphohydrolase [Accumulibacter sp.]MBO3715614.1 nucleotide pyrophosphohydrolase [Accumulibacter sp.]
MSLLADLTAQVLAFRDERDWAQFHTLRNLIVSLNLEAGELLELTQWKNDTEMEMEMAALASNAEAHAALCDECADVLIYLLLIADRAGIDLEAAARAKLARNAERYPVETSYGSSRKYSATADGKRHGP